MNTIHPVIAGVLGLGGPELILVLVIVMVLFGGKRLPELASGLGKSIKEFKRASRETEESFHQAIPPPPAPAVPAEAAVATPTVAGAGTRAS